MDGQLVHTSDGRVQLRFTRRFRHPPAQLWRALTEPEHLAAWFPTQIDGERVPGATLQFVFRNGEGPTLDGEMVRYEPPAVLEFRWGKDVLRFDVRPDGEGSVLTFVNTFDELGRAARDAAGWHVCLDALAARLDGRAAHGDWPQVHQHYLELFGPEAATIGPPTGAHPSG
jgi:uncharacterized protein YndB with AHSA1/START domain